VIPTAHQLADARMKLQRAEEHFGDLMLAHQAFTDRNPYRMLAEDDEKPGYTLWRAKIIEPPPLELWGSMVGECVHALRSALDHTAFRLVRINRPKSDYSEFPIFKDRGKWRERRSEKLPDVPARALAEVQRLQPYKRGANARFHPLWIIHALDIVDKHRRLNLIGPLVRDVSWVTRDCQVADDERFAGPFEDGTPIVRFLPKPTGPNMHVTAVFSFDITFGRGELLEGEPVLDRLNALRMAAGAAVSRFDKYFPPKG